MITAVVMVGEDQGISEAVSWVQNACRAAAADLIEQLSGSAIIDRIILVTPNAQDLDAGGTAEHITSKPGSIHVGRRLADLTKQFDLNKVVYFGGGSAPLLADEALEVLLSRVAASEEGVFTNNRFASDWAGIVPAKSLADFQERVPKDNMLGWVLSTEAGLPVEVEPPSAASRLDIDTPADLLTLALYPGTRPRLKAFLGSLPLDLRPLSKVLEVLRQDASRLFLSGRVSPEAWQALNRATQCWVRVLSEERGMVSSGRLQQGKVFSMLADHIEQKGFVGWLRMLEEQADAALMDNRVILAHRGKWPSKADRFASDLGLVDEVSDPWLREFTQAVMASALPIVMGGHGLVAGDLYAICDILALGAH